MHYLRKTIKISESARMESPIYLIDEHHILDGCYVVQTKLLLSNALDESAHHSSTLKVMHDALAWCTNSVAMLKRSKKGVSTLIE